MSLYSDCRSIVIRITSYNVCYTKLLRDAAHYENELSNALGNDPNNTVYGGHIASDNTSYYFAKEDSENSILLSRITSYNVCYTKLLRKLKNYYN